MKRLLIVGFGDVARRLLPLLPPGVALRRASRSEGYDLDRPETLAGLADWADALLHCAPPPDTGADDARTAHLVTILERGILPARLVYISTSGVYGDCSGALVDETRPPVPHSDRARRRAAAEALLGAWCAARGVALVVLRVPGIYAADRLPIERLRAGTPVLRDEDDVYTNHVHADDLAAIALRALRYDAPPGAYNAADDSELKMGQWLDLVADHFRLPRPPRVARRDAAGRIPAALLSFMSESRRLDNRKMKELLGVRLRYPTVYDGLRAASQAA